MGVKIVGGAFAASVKSFIQHGRASTKYWPGVSESLIGYSDRGSINPRTEWPGGGGGGHSIGGSLKSTTPIWRPLVGEILTWPWNGRTATTTTKSLSCSFLKHATALAMFLESFRGCFGTSSGAEGPPLVKLPIKESVVKLYFPALVQPFFVF